MQSNSHTDIPQLLNTVLSGLNNLSARDLARLGVKGQSARALIVLLDHGQLRCSRLSRLLGLEATALSHLLRTLARKHLIMRTRVENDNRAVEVRLTERGRRVAQACQGLTCAFERKLLRGLSSQELRLLERILHKMDDNITPLRHRPGRTPGPAGAVRRAKSSQTDVQGKLPTRKSAAR
jgi:DNA-binding MarR family transcriptional regulator